VVFEKFKKFIEQIHLDVRNFNTSIRYRQNQDYNRKFVRVSICLTKIT